MNVGTVFSSLEIIKEPLKVSEDQLKYRDLKHLITFDG